VVVNKHDAVFLVRTIAVEVPTGGDGLLVERAKEGLFNIVRDGHVIFDSIEAAEDDIE
jgi:hypothetical protein